MNLDYLTNAELIRHVDNTPCPSALERLLVDRLVSVMQDIEANLRRLHDNARQTEIDYGEEPTGLRNMEARDASEVRAGAVPTEHGTTGGIGASET